jgi:predicted N-formylglutamate amidohydrolase
MESLLAADEFPAVDLRDADGPYVIVCEHASNALPRSLGSLGLARQDFERHIAWDPGALDVASLIADGTGSPLVAQRYSRLAIDCNRDPALPDAIPERSEYTDIPGNMALSSEEKTSRIKALWEPFHAALDRLIGARLGSRKATTLVTVHSFTPIFRGFERPWHAGIISTDDRSFSDRVLAVLRRDPELAIGDNEPYSAKDNVDYTIRRHGRDRGLPHVMIEIRNDLVRSARDVAAWSERLTGALKESADAIGLIPSVGAKLAT